MKPEKSGLDYQHARFLKEVSLLLAHHEKKNKRFMEKLAASFSILDKTEVKELIELAIVIQARHLAHQRDTSTQERFEAIVRLYESQMSLSHRTSQSMLLQQYSTPAPIGYLAGLYCGVDEFNAGNRKVLFEPSAGNGLLTIACRPERCVVNEIDGLRNHHLSIQGYQGTYRVDATKDFSKTIDKSFFRKFHAVITNPPFGYAGKGFEIDGYPIATLEHLMAIRALEAMRDEGKAAIIIGGHTRYDDKGRIEKGAQRIFFNYLYAHYQVEDVIPINGSKLYSRQGTSFNTRLILINRRKKQVSGAAPLHDPERDRQVSDYDALFQRVLSHLYVPETTETMTPFPQLTDAFYDNYRSWHQQDPQACLLIAKHGDYYVLGERANAVAKVFGLPLRRQSFHGQPQAVFKIPFSDTAMILDRLKGLRIRIVDTLTSPSTSASADHPAELADLEQELEEELRRLQRDGDLGAPYLPASEGCIVLNTVVPDSMEAETRTALDTIKAEVGGDIDEFVRQRLRYASKKDLCKALSAEQTDAVAMAIYNIEAREQGMVIGDQTGIGKGRVAAAMIRYAVLQGHHPVFITEKPNLFSDLYRDLIAVGSGHLVPFIVNGRESKTDIKDENGDVLYQALAPAEQQAFFAEKRVPSHCDFVLATYSQFNSPEKKPEKPQFLLEVAKGNVLILDESHNASGSSQVGEFLQRVLYDSKGVVFLSATFAKRPDNMPIYAMKTAISDANMSKSDLVGAITSGGVALQEILASQLVKEGQMLRRERSFEGVEVNYISLDEMETEHKAIADNITTVLRAIIAFQKEVVDEIVNEMDDIAIASGKEVNLREGTSQAGVDNQPYFSKVFNVIHQMLFSIKASAVADRAILRLKEGKKPVIAFASTMGSFIEQMENNIGLPVGDGDTIRADFSEVLMRGLDGILRYTETTAEGNKEYKKLDLSELTQEARNRYLELADTIKRMSSGISISPIDIIVKKLSEAGFRVAEVTGRKYEVQINPKTNQGLVKTRQKVNTNDAFRQFNNNEVDVLLINQSGSTGASAHAIVTPKVPASEVKQRVMIVLQAELDINTEVQKRGRINRTGQILSPIYDYVMSAIPAEKRLMMMLQKKLKSLDANTTSNQKQSSKILDVPDFLNKYGDKVVTHYLTDNPEVNKLLGDPLHLASTTGEEAQVLEDAAHRVSGRVAVLSTKMQADFYNEIAQSYSDYVEYLKQTGDYDLEVEAMNLEAETISQKVIRMGKGGDSEFGTDSILEKVEANVQRKPFTKTELENILKESLDGQDAKQIQQALLDSYKEYADNKFEELIRENEEQYVREIANIQNEKKALKIAEKQGEEALQTYVKERSKELKEAANKQHALIETAMLNKRQYLTRLFKFFYTGQGLLYPIATYLDGSVNVPAVFIGFLIDKRKKNPYAPSNVRLRFAIASSHKYIAIPASYTKDLQAIIGVSHDVPQKPAAELLTEWEEAIRANARSRNIRYIITGNILQAFAGFKGKLVSYTTKGGDTRKGILMPEYWESDEGMSNQVAVPIGRAYKVVASLVKNQGITTENGVSLFNQGEVYKIIVAASASKAGNVFLDADVLDLVEHHNFEKTSDKMVGYLQPEKLKAFLGILQAKTSDSLLVSMNQFNLVKNEPGAGKPRHPIALLSPEEADEEERLQLLALSVEVELELELELMQMNEAA